MKVSKSICIALIFSLISYLSSSSLTWAQEASGTNSTERAGTQTSGQYRNAYSRAFPESSFGGHLLNQTWGRFFGAVGSISGWIGGNLGMVKTQKKVDKTGQGYGVVSCGSGMGVFKTGLPPPIPPWIPVWVPNPPSEADLTTLANLSVSSKESTDLAAGKAKIGALPLCERLCYSNKDSLTKYKAQYPNKAKEFQDKYDKAKGDCEGKSFISHILAATGDIKTNCTCTKIEFPYGPIDPPPPIKPLLAASRQLSARQSAAEITLEPPKPEENVVAETEAMLSDESAAVAGKVEAKNKKLPDVIKNGGTLVNAGVQNANGETAVAGGGADIKLNMGHTDVLSREGIKYNLDPNGGVYGTYGKGGGGAGKGGRGLAGWAGGAGGANGGTGGSDSMDFGGDEKGDNESAMGSVDPEDYFGMIGINDDIFKVVSRRYMTKSKLWLSQEIKAPSSHD